MALLVGCGILTAVPLLLFAGAANRISMTVIGFIQYVSPTISLVLAVTLFGEEFTVAHGVCFALIWLGIAAVAAGKPCCPPEKARAPRGSRGRVPRTRGRAFPAGRQLPAWGVAAVSWAVIYASIARLGLPAVRGVSMYALTLSSVTRVPLALRSAMSFPAFISWETRPGVTPNMRAASAAGTEGTPREKPSMFA